MLISGVPLMSENMTSSSAAALLHGASGAPISAGTMLRQAREAQGLHIGALAVSLKVSVKKLEALEANQFDLLPGAVFIRALAASVCRTLKIDPDPVLQQMPQTTAPLLKSSDGGINIPFRSSGVGAARWSMELLTRPFVWVILGLLAGAALLVVVPFPPRSEEGAPLKAESTMSPESAVAAQAAPVAAPVATPASADQAAVPGSGATAGAVVFKAHGMSWVEVIDANRVVQVRKNLSDGEVVGVSGAMPLSVVVGRADHTEVLIGDQPFDLSTVSKDRVARFEVK